jgi:hypothetical protein
MIPIEGSELHYLFFQVVFWAWNRWHIDGKSEHGQQWGD